MDLDHALRLAGGDDGRFATERLHDGFFNEDGRIWSPGGTLLAQSRQLGVLLDVPGEGPAD